VIIEPMRRLIILVGMLVSTVNVEAATLNKCIDAQGRVTYSNLPCRNAREARTVEIDPVPLPDPVRSTPAQAQPAKPVASRSKETPTLRLDTQRTTGKPAPRASARQCDAITDKLGRVFDKMDLARRKGYTPEQMNAWDQEVKELERKKQQSGCF
jgi:hypothetical protein